eukprot:1156927-Pelagomonas_calceolata.AAC.9
MEELFGVSRILVDAALCCATSFQDMQELFGIPQGLRTKLQPHGGAEDGVHECGKVWCSEKIYIPVCAGSIAPFRHHASAPSHGLRGKHRLLRTVHTLAVCAQAFVGAAQENNYIRLYVRLHKTPPPKRPASNAYTSELRARMLLLVSPFFETDKKVREKKLCSWQALCLRKKTGKRLVRGKGCAPGEPVV